MSARLVARLVRFCDIIRGVYDGGMMDILRGDQVASSRGVTRSGRCHQGRGTSNTVAPSSAFGSGVAGG